MQEIFRELSFTCMVCGDRRPDDKISVYKTDQSKAFGLPEGSVQQNVRYCNDRKPCIDGAPGINLGPLPEYEK